MPGKRDHSRRLLAFAREMRKAPTDAERKLWYLLRRGKLNGHRFRRQVPVAGYILDFCCLEAGIGVEADGGQHDEKGKEYDRRRSVALLQKGIRIMRFSDIDILKHPGAVQATIYRALTDGTPSLPSPGIPGEGKDEAIRAE
jgi:very-short-patch-repair endonuclease